MFAPPHLYGMLAATDAGLELLAKERSLMDMFSLLKGFPGNGASSAGHSAVAELKAAVWAVCSVAATPLGAALVERQEGVLAAVVAMAERAASYPLRGTAVYALSLVASTRKGKPRVYRYIVIRKPSLFLTAWPKFLTLNDLRCESRCSSPVPAWLVQPPLRPRREMARNGRVVRQPTCHRQDAIRSGRIQKFAVFRVIRRKWRWQSGN